jgi:hypothetical protein
MLPLNQRFTSVCQPLALDDSRPSYSQVAVNLILGTIACGCRCGFPVFASDLDNSGERVANASINAALAPASAPVIARAAAPYFSARP